MRLDEFFQELINSTVEKSNARGKYNGAFGFRPDESDMWGISPKLNQLIKNYRSNDKTKSHLNRELWADVVKKDIANDLGLFKKYQGDVKLRMKLQAFLDFGPPDRMR